MSTPAILLQKIAVGIDLRIWNTRSRDSKHYPRLIGVFTDIGKRDLTPNTIYKVVDILIMNVYPVAMSGAFITSDTIITLKIRFGQVASPRLQRTSLFHRMPLPTEWAEKGSWLKLH